MCTAGGSGSAVGRQGVGRRPGPARHDQHQGARRLSPHPTQTRISCDIRVMELWACGRTAGPPRAALT